MTKLTFWLFCAAVASAVFPAAYPASSAEPQTATDQPTGTEDFGPVASPRATLIAPEIASAATPGAPVSFGTLLAGLGRPAAETSILRFTNGSNAAGTMTLTLYDASSGTQVATWTSASIPARAALQVTAAQIAGAATPTLTAAQKAAVFNAVASGTVHGTVQHLNRTATSVSTVNSCGGGSVGAYGYFEGPGFVGLTGILRLANGGTTAGTVRLAIRDAATGNQLATWTSPSVPAKGPYSITSTALAAAATPPIPAATVALGIAPTGFTGRIVLQHFANVMGTTATADLGAACAIFGPPPVRPVRK